VCACPRGWSVAGCDLVNWLHTHVQGLSDRREARKYATAMLHAGLIRHTVNKSTFSEQCYYTLGELVTNPGTLYTVITLLGTVWVPNHWGIPTGGNFRVSVELRAQIGRLKQLEYIGLLADLAEVISVIFWPGQNVNTVLIPAHI